MYLIFVFFARVFGKCSKSAPKFYGWSGNWKHTLFLPYQEEDLKSNENDPPLKFPRLNNEHCVYTVTSPFLNDCGVLKKLRDY